MKPLPTEPKEHVYLICTNPRGAADRFISDDPVDDLAHAREYRSSTPYSINAGYCCVWQLVELRDGESREEAVRRLQAAKLKEELSS